MVESLIGKAFAKASSIDYGNSLAYSLGRDEEENQLLLEYINEFKST